MGATPSRAPCGPTQFAGTTTDGLSLGSVGVSIAGGAGTGPHQHQPQQPHRSPHRRHHRQPHGHDPLGHRRQGCLFYQRPTGLFTRCGSRAERGFCLLPGQSREVWVDDTGRCAANPSTSARDRDHGQLRGHQQHHDPSPPPPRRASPSSASGATLVTAFATGDGDYTDSMGVTATDDILFERGIGATVRCTASTRPRGAATSPAATTSSPAGHAGLPLHRVQRDGGAHGRGRADRVAGRYFGS